METKQFEIYYQDNIIVEEAFSFLKANFNFHNDENTIKSLSILSCKPSEGKTTTAINLAINFVRGGIKVLLVDTDLRKPVEAKRLGGDNFAGLSEVLLQRSTLDDVIMATNIKDLYYIPSGLKTPYPSELLSSVTFEKFLTEVSMRYELIILDTPPLSSVIDGTIVASKADASILVVRSGKVELSKLQRMKEQLQKANANVLGVVLNVVEKSEYKNHLHAYNYFKDEERFLKNAKQYKETISKETIYKETVYKETISEKKEFNYDSL